jgi:hypothetical protein
LAATQNFQKETLMLRTALFKLAILQPESYIKNLKSENDFKKKRIFNSQILTKN